jgi:hypothetical protein
MNAFKKASGSFEVTLTPLPNTEVSSHPLLGRMLLVKKFTGDLVADARGQMLSAGTNTRGSACYVAIDHVTGTIDGRTGGFLLQHCGTMNRGEPSLSIHVVPDLLQFMVLRSRVEDLDGLPTINLSETPLEGWSRFVKRGFDLIVAASAMLLLSPVGLNWVIAPVCGFNLLRPASSVPIQTLPFLSSQISLTALPLIEFCPFCGKYFLNCVYCF